MFKTASHLLTCTLILTLAVFSQDTEPPLDDHICNDDFAKSLVDQQVAESRSVAETDKRVRILTKSADFLWKFEQPRAREYFAEAFKVASDRFKEKGLENKTYGGGISTPLPDYRFEVVNAIAKHDPAWARRLSDELLKEYEASAKDRSETDHGREVNSLMSIALESIQTNPSLSWYIYRRLMRSELEHQWFWQLFSIAGKDRAFADQLYTELLASHANASPRKVNFLSAYAFGTPRIFGYEGGQYIASIPEGYTPRPQLQTRYLDLFLRRADAFASDPANFTAAPAPNRMPEAVHIVSAAAELEPIVMQTLPQFLPRLQAVRIKTSAMLSENDRKSMADREKWKSAGTRSFDERIAELETADSEGKLKDSMILSMLMFQFKSDEQFERFEPWIDKVSDAEARSSIANYYWFLRSKFAIKENRLEDARTYAAKVPEVEHQAILWFEIAEKQLADINDAANAYTTLRDVGALARKAEDSVAKARVLLGLANLYEKLNHSFAISELSDAVGVINKVKDADLETGYVLRFIKVKDFGMGASFSTPGYDLETTFRALSKTDYSLPLSNARSIADNYYRTLAVIAIAKNCIDRPRQKPNSRTGDRRQSH